MDNSRNADLEALHKRFNDPSVHKVHRDRARTSFEKIQAQVKDKNLVKLRHRLVNATKAQDGEEAWNIEQEIRQYERR